MSNINRHKYFKYTACTLVLCLIFSSSGLAALQCDTCPHDLHGNVAHSKKARAEFRKHHPCPVNGKKTGKCPGYIIDYIRPLKRGGADWPSNMQWQERAAVRDRKRAERLAQ